MSFRQKGNGLIGMLEYADAHLPGGREALLTAIDDAEMRAYCRQRFLAGSWYDVRATVALCNAAVKLSGKSFDEHMRTMMRWLAERDIRGVYKVLLALASPDMVLQRLPKIAAAHFDFVTAEINAVGPGHYESRSLGIPVDMAAIYKAVSEIYLTRALETAGAKHLIHRWVADEPGGEREGQKLLNLRREIKWGRS